MPDTQSKRIALLVDHVESHYHQEIVNGALRAARAGHARTLIVTGGWLGRPPTSPVARNFIYEFLHETRLDGMVVLGGSLSNFCGVDRFVPWLEQFRHLPVVTIGLELAGHATVRTDNDVGMYGAVSHLIEVHGRRKIAFVRGPAEGPEAEARYRAYRRALADHEIALEERLIVEAGLGRDSGMAAVAELFDKRHLSSTLLDAIVGVNDDVARGVLEELKRRSVVVPDQVALLGFDDAASARAANPPLSTVNQRVEQQSFDAMRLVLEAVEKGRAPESLVLESVPVYRASCGCTASPQNDSGAHGQASTGMARSLRLALVERRMMVTAELARAAAGRVTKAPGWEVQLLDALAKDVVGESPGELLRTMATLGRRHTAAGGDIIVFHDILSKLRYQVLSLSSVEPEQRPRLEDIFQDCRFALAQIAVDAERSRQEMLNLRVRIITKECLALFGSGTFDNVANSLEEHLPAIGIDAFVVSRFQVDRGISPELTPLARRSTGLWHARSHVLYARDLGLDPVLEQQDALVIEPLEFDGVPHGIAAFSWGAHTPEHYEQLREVLSAAMRATSP